MCLRRKRKDLEQAVKETVEQAVALEESTTQRMAAEHALMDAHRIANKQRASLERNGFGDALLVAMKRRRA